MQNFDNGDGGGLQGLFNSTITLHHSPVNTVEPAHLPISLSTCYILTSAFSMYLMVSIFLTKHFYTYILYKFSSSTLAVVLYSPIYRELDKFDVVLKLIRSMLHTVACNKPLFSEILVFGCLERFYS